MRYGRCLGLALWAATGLWLAAPAAAMTMKDCSAKYQAAKAAGSLAGRNWTAFRATECAGVTAKPQATTAAAVAPDPAAVGAAPVTMPQALSLPSSIDPKYAAEKPSRARLHTCADAYRTAKKTGTLKGLRWIQKGGGFYSQCARKLKASAKG